MGGTTRKMTSPTKWEQLPMVIWGPAIFINTRLFYSVWAREGGGGGLGSLAARIQQGFQHVRLFLLVVPGWLLSPPPISIASPVYQDGSRLPGTPPAKSNQVVLRTLQVSQRSSSFDAGQGAAQLL